MCDNNKPHQSLIEYLQNPIEDVNLISEKNRKLFDALMKECHCFKMNKSIENVQNNTTRGK